MTIEYDRQKTFKDVLKLDDSEIVQEIRNPTRKLDFIELKKSKECENYLRQRDILRAIKRVFKLIYKKPFIILQIRFQQAMLK